MLQPKTNILVDDLKTPDALKKTNKFFFFFHPYRVH